MAEDDAPEQESMRRVTIVVTLDQKLVVVEGKSDQSNRLFTGDLRADQAAAYLKFLLKALGKAVPTGASVALNVDRANMTLTMDDV